MLDILKINCKKHEQLTYTYKLNKIWKIKFKTKKINGMLIWTNQKELKDKHNYWSLK